MCKNTSNFDETPVLEVEEMLKTFNTCAASFGENTSRRRCLSGRPVVWSGGLVQVRRANVQARRADEGGLCKFLPRHVAPEPRHVAQCKKHATVLFRPDFFLFDAVEARALILVFENELPLSHFNLISFSKKHSQRSFYFKVK